MPAEWTHDRLKAKEWRPEKDTGIYVYEPKYDGHRMTAFKQPDGRLLVYGRQIEPHLEKFSKLEYLSIVRHMAKVMPAMSSIDFEIVWPGHRACEVVTGINGQESMEIHAFAIPWWKGESHITMSFAWIDTLLRANGIPSVNRQSYQALFRNRRSDLEIKEQLLEWARTLKLEGWMLKRNHYEGWFKLKVERTADVVVTDIKDGSGEFTGLCGALMVGVYGVDGSSQLVEIARCSGMDMDVREAITETDIGRVCEIRYQETTGKKRLRHPRFVRWRDDEKKPEECRWDQFEKVVG